MAYDCCCISTLIYGAGLFTLAKFIIPFILKLVKGNAQPEPLEKDWKKDTVYLYQFKGNQTVSSLSPFCVKVEAYMRIHKIKFERRYTLSARGANGKLPMIELNGEVISDSEIILKRLAEKFNLKDYDTAEKAAIGHAVSRFIDNHTFPILHYFAATNFGPGLRLLTEGGPIPPFVVELLLPIVSPYFACKLRHHAAEAVGKFTEEEYRELLKNDLSQIQTLLGSNPFLLGSAPTPADCTLFGHLAGAVYLFPGTTNELGRHLATPEFKPLREWVDRCRDEVFGSEFHM